MKENAEQPTRIALVTGAGQGMGQAIATTLARSGMAVVVNDLSMAKLTSTLSVLREMGSQTMAAPADVNNGDDVSEMVRDIDRVLGPVDVLVNNAGVLRPTKIIDIDEEEWDLVCGVNLRSSFLCTRAVLPGMISQGWGRIVNMSSTAGKNVSTIGGAHYTAAKAGILGLTRAAAKEVARHGVTVNAVCPGLIDTEMTRHTITSEQIAAYENSFPISRLGSPNEVAQMVAYLVSEAASYVTGAALDINGGDLMV